MIKRLLLLGNQNAQSTRLATYALELGAEVLFVGDETLFPVKAPAGYSFLPLGRFASLRLGEDGDAERFAEEVAKLTAAAAEFAPDVSHVLGIDIYFSLAQRAHLRPLGVAGYGYLNHWLVPQPALSKHDRRLLNVDVLLLESPHLVDIGRRLLPASVRVEEFAIGLDSKYFYPASTAQRAAWRRALQIPPEATVIFSPRGWAPIYNHHRILAAFAKILPHLPTPTYLLFVKLGREWDVAKSKATFAQAEQQAQELGITENVRWLPHFPASTIATLYNVADLIVSFCAPDTFPHSLLEALACERPVLAPDLPTFANSVLAEHCRLIPNDADGTLDDDALAAAMLDSINHPPSPAALTAARCAVLARYDKPVILQQIVALYDALSHAATRSPKDSSANVDNLI